MSFVFIFDFVISSIPHLRFLNPTKDKSFSQNLGLQARRKAYREITKQDEVWSCRPVAF